MQCLADSALILAESAANVLRVEGMPLYLVLFIESIITYIVFVGVKHGAAKPIEAIVLVTSRTVLALLVFELGLEFGLTAVIANSGFIIILTLVSTMTTRNWRMSLVFSIFANLIIILSGNIASAIFTLVYLVFPNHIALGRDGVSGDIVMSVVYHILMIVVSLPTSRKVGKLFHSQIKGFDENLKRRLFNSILSGAIIILCVFFVFVFLRDLLTAASILILAYGISLAVVFVYLIFSVFAFASSLRKDLELKQKSETLNSLESYTKSVEDMAIEMRKFRHDHMNLMLGFNAHIESGDLERLRGYYEQYMGEFVASSDAMEANIDKLGNIETPELKAILFAKFIQASSAGIGITIEVENQISIGDDYIFLDTCRIFGILMDNAIDACKGSENAEIRLLATMTGIEAYFVLQNTCAIPPPMNKISQRGFTTKPGMRGMGLYIVSRMVTRNKHLTLKTNLRGEYFVQELTAVIGEGR